jgi:multidrug efflux pump subunit AcrB
VIDDAVVITENIVRHSHITKDRPIAIRDAVQELIWPVTSSTITTVVVFLPLGLLTGVEGQFFHALSITLTIAVLVSLVVALTIIPLLSEQFLAADIEAAARGSLGHKLAGAESAAGSTRCPTGTSARLARRSATRAG